MPPRASLRDLVEVRRSAVATDVVLVEGATGATRTWADLGRAADAWSERSAALGSDGPVGLVCADPLEMAVAFVGAVAAGVCVSPLNPAGTPSEVAAQAATLGLTAVVSDAEALPAVTHLTRLDRWVTGPGGPVLVQPADLAADAGGRRPRGPDAGGRRPRGPAAMVLASSGTTGTPKIVPLTEQHLLHTARNLVAHHQLTESDRGYCPLPLFHINGLVVGVLSTVVAGSSLVIDRKFSASHFWERVAAHGATWLNLVPAIMTVLSERPAPAVDVSRRIGFARSASAPLPEATRERFEARCGVAVLETYGMTEAASQIAANPRRAADRRSGSVGRPVGVDLRVVDHARRPVGADVVGQVQIRGESVVSEYWVPSGPDARPARGSDGWLDTGDLGRMDADGFVYLAGRLDDVINRGGEKVLPREVEETLLRDDGVTAAAVVGRPHPTVGEEPVAFVLSASGAGDAEALRQRLDARCQAELSRFKRPAEILVAETLPAGPTGKIKHGELRRAMAGGAVPSEAAGGGAPR